LAGGFPNFSPYVYSNNNPLRYSDPTGMQSEDEVDQVQRSQQPTTSKSEWSYNKELTDTWYPDRKDLSFFTSGNDTILEQSTFENYGDVNSTEYFFLNDDKWTSFTPAESTIVEDVTKLALTPILLTGAAVTGGYLIEAIGPLAIEGVNSALPYLAKSALVVGEKVGMAYEAVQGIVATNPESAGIILESAATNFEGPETLPNPISTNVSEVFKNFAFLYINRNRLKTAGNEILESVGTAYSNTFSINHSENDDIPLLCVS
jgi:hypothetical protein